MEYKADPDKVFENINRALGDAIQTAIIGGLFYACKQYRRKPKLKRVQHSSTACPLCQSHCGEYSVDEYETSKASEFHRGCRCKLLVSWKEDKPEHSKTNEEATRLLSLANSKEKTVTPRLKRLETKYAQLVGLEYRIKSKESLERKLLELARESKESPFSISGNLKDVLRYTYILEPKEFIYEYERIVDNLGYMGYNIFSLKNTLKQDHVMYKGLNVAFKDVNDYVFEIQFHTKLSYKIKESMHGLYEEYRMLESNSDRAKELARKMISISDKIKMPEGADRI